MAKGRFISYLRVSTQKQHSSGLGLEAQRSAVENFLNGGSWELLEEYLEVESGKKTNRVELDKALHHAKVTGATLVIAKLGRLSRNAEFLLRLQRKGVDFVAADMPQANTLTIGIMALVAQQEREAISKRTKEALAAAKARGVKLGNPHGAIYMKGLGNDASIAVIKRKAQEHAEDVFPIIQHIQQSGITTTRGIAKELNDKGMLTPRGKSWYGTSVANLLRRMTKINEPSSS